MPEAPSKRKLAAILSADVVGYSRLMGEDERATVDTLKQYRAAIQRVVELHDGRVVNAPGDALLAEFPSAVEAVRSAVEIQQDLEGRNSTLPDERQMHYRIGVNLGDVIEEADGTLYGDGVNVAARLEALAEARGVCVSSKVFEEVESKVDLGFEFVGQQTIKNIAKPVRVYRVRIDGRPTSPRVKARAFWRHRRNSLIAAAVMALVGGGIAGWQVMRPRQLATDPVLAMPTGPSIAVLPLTNMSDDPKDDYFSDGLTEDLITELARFRDLYVLARNTTFQYKGQAVDVPAVGRKLGVRYMLEGSARKTKERVRITVQLIEVASGAHLWGDRYDRALKDIFAVQDGITGKVVGAIAGRHG